MYESAFLILIHGLKGHGRNALPGDATGAGSTGAVSPGAVACPLNMSESALAVSVRAGRGRECGAPAARDCAGRTGVQVRISIAEPDAGARACKTNRRPARYAGRDRRTRETVGVLRGSGAACDAPARRRRKGPVEPRCGDRKARRATALRHAPSGHPADRRGGGNPREFVLSDRVAIRAMKLDLQLPTVEPVPERDGRARGSTIRTLQVSGSGSDGSIRCAHFRRRSSQVPDDAAHLAGVEVAGRSERHAIASSDEQRGSEKSLQLANMPADGAGRDSQFGRRVQEALMPARRFECLERVQRREWLIGHVFSDWLSLREVEPD